MLTCDIGDEKCADLLEGNAEMSQQRSHLKAKKAQLDQFSRTLDDLRKEFSDDGQTSSSGVDTPMQYGEGLPEEDRSETIM